MCFFFQAEDGIRDVAVTGVQTCALPISSATLGGTDAVWLVRWEVPDPNGAGHTYFAAMDSDGGAAPSFFDGETSSIDRKSTRLNSSHGYISYAVFCL